MSQLSKTEQVLREMKQHNIDILALSEIRWKGADRKYCPEVLGLHGLGQINENGALLVDFALSNDLVVGGTLFEHKNVHKYTWTSPDDLTRNQIDHFLIAIRWRTSLLDVRGYRGADAQSNHMLMIAHHDPHLQIKLRAQKKI
ncbi:hypothetical protein QYM36_009927 [Artemia franciscana]|uniref:Uncharacterized protein n=1 Tax=Artemia franciscana TaxID=6661 RepID=A0AA88HSS4_ARTSF|nr:hypothetical protein QYM36_009927 [Artemia franciscana]